MIYDKTIAMLRCCADSTTGCGDCVFKNKNNCICELLDHAANVIESLRDCAVLFFPEEDEFDDET